MDMKYTFTTSSEGYTETWEYTIPVNDAELVSKAVSGVNLCDRCGGAVEPLIALTPPCYCNCHNPWDGSFTYTDRCKHCATTTNTTSSVFWPDMTDGTLE